MDVEFDPEKSAANERERGMPFDMVAELEWNRAIVRRDGRQEYGEDRFLALVPMNQRIYAVCYTIRPGAPPFASSIRRVISFRKANRREGKFYEEATSDQ